MPANYAFYHGAALREIIVSAANAIKIEPHDRYGRANVFLLNSQVGLLLKHSAKRLSPWVFNFSKDHQLEVQSLSSMSPNAFACFICGEDGICTVPVAELCELLGANTDQQWIRFDRRTKQMYKVTSSSGGLPYKLPRGVEIVIRSLEPTIPSAAY